MVVVNKSGLDLIIEELHRIVPADGRPYILPYSIAVKYKGRLTPIQLSDNIPQQSVQQQTTKEIEIPEEIVIDFDDEEDDEVPLQVLEINEIDETDNDIEEKKIDDSYEDDPKPLKGKRIKKSRRKSLLKKKSTKNKKN